MTTANLHHTKGLCMFSVFQKVGIFLISETIRIWYRPEVFHTYPELWVLHTQITHNLIHITHTITHAHVLHFFYCSKKFLDWRYIRNNYLFLYIEIFLTSLLIFFIIYNVLFRQSKGKLSAPCISYEDFVVSSDF